MALNSARNREEIDKWRRVFSKVDKDNDGQVPLLDLQSFASSAQKDPCLDEKRVKLINKMANKYRSNYTKQEKRNSMAPPKNTNNNNEGANFTDSIDQLDKPVTSRDFILLMTAAKAGREGCARRCCKSMADFVLPNDNRPAAHAFFDNDAKLWCWPRPAVFMLCVTVLQIAVFIYYSAKLCKRWNDFGWLTECIGCFSTNVNGTEIVGNLVFLPQLRVEAWRFLTYALLHNGLLHLISISLLQIILGFPLELCQGIWRIAALYILATATGSLLTYATDGQSMLVGASAGCFALICAFGIFMVLNWPEMNAKWVRLAMVLIYILIESLLAVYRRFFAPPCEQTSYAGHLAGALTGVLLGPGLLRSIGIRPRWYKVLAGAGAILFCLILGAMVALVCTVKPIEVIRQCH